MKKAVPHSAKIIGMNIRKYRKASNLTQRDLAQYLDVTFQQIQKYEEGRNRVAVEGLYRLSKLFQIPMELFFYDDEMSEYLNDIKILEHYWTAISDITIRFHLLEIARKLA